MWLVIPDEVILHHLGDFRRTFDAFVLEIYLLFGAFCAKLFLISGDSFLELTYL